MRNDIDLSTAALSIRRNIIELANNSRSNVHVAPALSIADIMATLYFYTMEYDDKFILSKGHGALAYYTTLIEAGITSKEEFLKEAGEKFPSHPFRMKEWGVDYAGGSLGLGLSYGCGLAVSNRMLNNTSNIFVLMGDGELNEGVVWESAFFAAHNKLHHLIAIIDRNSMQSDGFSKDILKMDVESLWKSCGWNTVVCDGHDFSDLQKAFSSLSEDKPTAIIAQTVKGKGISFMENNKDWHHNKISDKQYADALRELDGEIC